jgi:hypothetical protein
MYMISWAATAVQSPSIRHRATYGPVFPIDARATGRGVVTLSRACDKARR